jgi:hypothetical protein
MTEEKEKIRDDIMEDTNSCTVVNNDSLANDNDANLDNFYEMHLTDTRETMDKRNSKLLEENGNQLLAR